jgi:hypothetical protein
MEQKHELPPTYDWKTQKRKYCCPVFTWKLLQTNPGSSHGSVFCHHGFYDRAMMVPENSKLAIEDGIKYGLLLHEVDVRLSRDKSDAASILYAFLAHDDDAGRVTAKAGKWASLTMKDNGSFPRNEAV